MSDVSPSPLLLGETVPIARLPRAVERACMWAIAALGAAATAGLMIFAVATQSGADAERITSGASYGTALLSALAIKQARPAF